MSAALLAPLSPSERERLVSVVDAALDQCGLQTYSEVKADLALAHVGFNAAVRERVIGLTSSENRRLRISLLVVLQDVLAVQALLAQGDRSGAEMAIFAMLPELRAAAHKMKPGSLPADVASLEDARERRDGAL